MFTCLDGKGGVAEKPSPEMLYSLPSEVNIAS